jgi:hypothetical protein
MNPAEKHRRISKPYTSYFLSWADNIRLLRSEVDWDQPVQHRSILLLILMLNQLNGIVSGKSPIEGIQ